MNTKCCNGREALSDPCQAIADGIINSESYTNFGLTKGDYLLLVAQCGTTSAVVDLTDVAEQILACCEASRLILIDIDTNTDEIEGKLDQLIALVTAGNVDLGDILIAVQAILTEAQAINANTDQIEALLNSIITILNAIDANTDTLEACCAGTNVLLASIESLLTNISASNTAGNLILTDIELNQGANNLLGTHIVLTGDESADPVAGNYSSWTVVRTDTLGIAETLVADGLPLYGQGDSTGEEGQPQKRLPAPVIVASAGATYAWRTTS